MKRKETHETITDKREYANEFEMSDTSNIGESRSEMK